MSTDCTCPGSEHNLPCQDSRRMAELGLQPTISTPRNVVSPCDDSNSQDTVSKKVGRCGAHTGIAQCEGSTVQMKARNRHRFLVKWR